MKLTAYRYGTTDITERMAFEDGSPDVKLEISLMFFLIETDGRKILVDVGCDTMPGFELREFEKPVNVLEASGIKRDEITDVILSHSHHDHIDALRYYPQARVYLQESEKAEAAGYIPNMDKLVTFTDEFSLCDGIRIKRVGGHTSGSSVVHLKADSGEYVLIGDACYTTANLVRKEPTGTAVSKSESEAFISEYTKPCYKVVVAHDPTVVDGIGCKELFN